MGSSRTVYIAPGPPPAAVRAAAEAWFRINAPRHRPQFDRLDGTTDTEAPGFAFLVDIYDGDEKRRDAIAVALVAHLRACLDVEVVDDDEISRREVASRETPTDPA